jgi:hypothetical protein
MQRGLVIPLVGTERVFWRGREMTGRGSKIVVDLLETVAGAKGVEIDIRIKGIGDLGRKVQVSQAGAAVGEVGEVRAGAVTSIKQVGVEIDIRIKGIGDLGRKVQVSQAGAAVGEVGEVRAGAVTSIKQVGVDARTEGMRNVSRGGEVSQVGPAVGERVEKVNEGAEAVEKVDHFKNVFNIFDVGADESVVEQGGSDAEEEGPSKKKLRGRKRVFSEDEEE